MILQYLRAKNILKTFLIISAISISTVWGASGDVDTSFNPGLVKMRYESGWIYKTSVRRIIIQPDGKVIAIGNFRAANKFTRDGIARFNADGTVDSTFRPPIFADVISQNSGNITAAALQTDGKILIGLSQNLSVGATVRSGVARLNSDGSLDTSFNILNNPNNGFNGEVSDIQVSADNKITFAGGFTYDIAGNGTRANIARVLTNGSPDLSFNALSSFSFRYVRKIELLSADKTLVASETQTGTAYLDRINSDGSIDGSFNSSTFTGSSGGYVFSIALEPTGKILVGGYFTGINGFSVPGKIVRLNPDGSFDTSFNPGNAGANSNILDIKVLSGGEILIGGTFGNYNGVVRRNIALLNSDGTLGSSVVYSGESVRFNYLAVQTDGKILVGADANEAPIPGRPLFRVNTDSSVEQSYQPVLGHFGYSKKVFVQADGKILVGGQFTFADGKYYPNLVRLNPNGSIDEQFTWVPLPSLTEISGIDVRSNGKIVVGGTGVIIADSDGTNPVYSLSGGYCPDVRFLPDGNILAVGNFYLRKLNGTTGQVDFSFAVQTDNYIRKFALQPDGKILIAGDFTSVNGVNRPRIARLNADGTVDTSFNPIGGANGTINDIALQSDGKIIIGGAFTGVNFDTNRKYLARLNSDGSLDTGFTPTPDYVISSLKIQPNGKILIGGIMTSVNGIPRKSMARLNQNGTLDPGFNLLSGADGNIFSITLQSDNSILIGGDFRYVNNLERIGLARLQNNSVQAGTAFDFDGDRKTDVSIFRPNAGEWWYLRSSDSSNRAFQFGSGSDKIVPADFTGDGKTDIATFKPSSGEWFILRSEDSSFYSFPFGTVGDIPVPGDFDGDGRSDPTIFRPSNSTWYTLNSSGGTTIRQFGISGDLPVVGDYDGDGKADLAIFRPSLGQWWINRSGTQTTIVYNFGTNTDKLVPADYTGDGRTDVAFYRPGSGEWFILRSEDASFYAFPFGAIGDIPVAGDYDGDGKADAAVFRPANNTWYKLQSASGFEAITFGITGDTPVPNAFVQ